MLDFDERAREHSMIQHHPTTQAGVVIRGWICEILRTTGGIDRFAGT